MNKFKKTNLTMVRLFKLILSINEVNDGAKIHQLLNEFVNNNFDASEPNNLENELFDKLIMDQDIKTICEMLYDEYLKDIVMNYIVGNNENAMHIYHIMILHLKRIYKRELSLK